MSKRRAKPRDLLPSIFKYLTLIISSVLVIIPISVVFIGSFKSKEEFATTSPLTLPRSWFNFENYTRAFRDGKMLLGFWNTSYVLILSLAGGIILGTMTAYVLHRFAFKMRGVIMGAFLLATLIPGVTTQVATFQLMSALELFNKLYALVILNLGTDIIAIYIFLQFMDSISVSLDESAMLDGASYLTIYRRIILPLLKPAIVTVIIIKGVGIYNDFYSPFLYVPSQEKPVISTALFKFKGPYGTQWEIICAAIIIAILPTLIIFIALQRYIYNGFTQGSVK